MDTHTKTGASASIEARLQQLADTRMNAVRSLLGAQERLRIAEEAVANAQREVRREWVRATQNGWTESDLRNAGLKAPDGVRRRARTARAARPANEPSPTPHEPTTHDHQEQS